MEQATTIDAMAIVDGAYNMDSQTAVPESLRFRYRLRYI